MLYLDLLCYFGLPWCVVLWWVWHSHGSQPYLTLQVFVRILFRITSMCNFIIILIITWVTFILNIYCVLNIVFLSVALICSYNQSDNHMGYNQTYHFMQWRYSFIICLIITWVMAIITLVLLIPCVYWITLMCNFGNQYYRHTWFGVHW